jgi:hypothetical protein
MNIGLIGVLLFMQFMMFGFLPSINPNISEVEQKKEAFQFILKKDFILVLEGIAGLIILYFVNKTISNNKKFLFFVFIIELSILLTSIIFFSFDYLGKFAK